MRLVPLNGTAVPTAVCDDVHFGGVELFREGIWGRICAGRFGGAPQEFTLDAQVICRQMGFPFGTTLDADVRAELLDNYDTLSEPTWATRV